MHRKQLMMYGREGFIYVLKLARCPHSLAASLAVLPSMSLIPSSSIVLIRGNHEPVNRLALNESIETRSLPTLARCYPRQLYLDHSHCPVLVPATLAALPSTRATPDRDVFYVADPSAPFTQGYRGQRQL
jgi:hypothetical protein